MAYKSSGLSVLAYANGFTLWHYGTRDTATEAGAPNYFNAAADMLRAGDMILANVDTGGAPGAGLFVVRSVAGGVVGVSPLTAFGTN